MAKASQFWRHLKFQAHEAHKFKNYSMNMMPPNIYYNKAVKNIKSKEKKEFLTYKGTPIRLSLNSSAETLWQCGVNWVIVNCEGI